MPRNSKSKSATRKTPDESHAARKRRRTFRDAAEFVDAVFAAHDPIAAAGKLLGKDRFVEKLLELKFGKPSAASEDDERPVVYVVDGPRPARERAKETNS